MPHILTKRNKKIKITKRANKIKFSSSVRSFSTSACLYKNNIVNRNIIKPLVKDPTISNFATIDLETINYNGRQIPLLIGLGHIASKEINTQHGFRIRGVFHVEQLLINKELLAKNVDLAVKDLWARFFDYLKKYSLAVPATIFGHNLGGFDGYL